MTNNTLIVAALSARGFAQAAVEAGFEVIVIDVFADADTCQFSKKAFKVSLDANSVDIADFKRIFAEIDLSHCAGFLYGSLFDDAVELLDWVSMRLPVIGNRFETMQLAKSANFFELLATLDIRYPQVVLQAQMQDDFFKQSYEWVSKKFGGSGGLHVKPATSKIESIDYYQRKLDGLPISLLFLADGETAQTVGFNQQILAPTENLPYRYAGAVSRVQLPQVAKNVLEVAAAKLTKRFALRGCNSLDAIWDGENVWVLELNPRLSATFHLYPNLLNAHLQACVGKMVDLPTSTASKAQKVLYADEALSIEADFIWPDGVTDISSPEFGAKVIKISQHAPICTVNVEAENADLAMRLVGEKTEALKCILYKKYQ